MYGEVRTRVTGLLAEADDGALDATAPATPEWRVRDVGSHLSGICADIVTGNLDGVATDPWTAAQVEARRAWPVEQLLAEWDEMGPRVEATIRQIPDLPDWRTLVVDAITHEHDIRGALGRPGARETDAIVDVTDAAVDAIGRRLATGDLGVLECTFADGSTRTVGAGPAATGLRITRFEFLRAATGRRSESQMASFDWEGDAHPEWLLFEIFAPRATPLIE